MANINIYEQDNTLLGGIGENDNIVYIPGFAATNTNVYIITTAGTVPTPATVGIAQADAESLPEAYNKTTPAVPQYYCNIADKLAWRCTAATLNPASYTWTAIDYVEPYSENEPVLCTSIRQFEAAFGSTPFTFSAAVTYANIHSFSANATNGLTNIVEARSYDKSYIMAKELIALGIPVLYENVVTRNNGIKSPSTAITNLYARFTGDSTSNLFSKFADSSDYEVKFITAGGYPVFEHYTTGTSTTYNDIVANMVAAVKGKGDEGGSGRGDAFVLIDHTDNPSRTLVPTDSASVYAAINSGNYALNTSYAAMFTPWVNYTTTTLAANITTSLPASFAYLYALGIAMQSNPDYLAIAGVTRGNLNNNFKGLNIDKSLTNSIANNYQKDTGVSINAITNIRPYGLTIWGNRTLKNNDAGMKALSFLNIRSLMCDIKKQAYETATSLMFEQNNDILWVNFLAGITPLLDQMKSSSGISGYKIYNNSVANSKKLSALIKLFPVYAVEDFDIYISLENNEVTVE